MLYLGIFPCHYKIDGEDVHKWPPHVHVYGDMDMVWTKRFKMAMERRNG